MKKTGQSLKEVWDNIHKPLKECKKPIYNYEDFEQQIREHYAKKYKSTKPRKRG